MRIIAGSARGVPLFAPNGLETRPTQDRVKESLFNILQGELFQARVLDLFAGSGALGLESLSRGAERAVLVDQDREAVQCIQRNVDKLRFAQRAAIYPCDWRQAVERLAKEAARFDLVFLDPPYRMTELLPLCDELAQKGLLAEGATVVWEHRLGAEAVLSFRFLPIRERSFGDTQFHLFRYQGEESQ